MDFQLYSVLYSTMQRLLSGTRSSTGKRLLFLHDNHDLHASNEYDPAGIKKSPGN